MKPCFFRDRFDPAQWLHREKRPTWLSYAAYDGPSMITPSETGSAPSSALPIVEQIKPPLSPVTGARLECRAREIVANEPSLSASEAFGPRVAAGLGDGPNVLFEDHAGVPLFTGRGNSTLEYRALLLAGDGDVVFLPCARDPNFEAYCHNVLGLGNPTVLPIQRIEQLARTPLPVLVGQSRKLMSLLTDVADAHNTINLVPYIGSVHVWRLAEKLAAAAGCQVRVAAPPPRLARAANDKLWFSNIIADVLGGAALPPSSYAHGPAALTGRVAALARHYEKVVVKVPDSAGSLGNIVLDCAPLRRLGPVELRRWLLSILSRVGVSSFPLLIGVWDQPVVSSPSVQLWIPTVDDGLPVVEGIFEQLVTGPQAEFIGAVPSPLASNWQERIAGEAMQLAYLLQRMGYFGPCSFDAVLVGKDTRSAELHWIECNGRWGGVSIPVKLANRLIGDWARCSLAIVQNTDYAIQARPFSAALQHLGGRLFQAGQGETGVVLLTPGNIVRGSGLHFIVLARTPEEAEREVLDVTRLLRRGLPKSRLLHRQLEDGRL